MRFSKTRTYLWTPRWSKDALAGDLFLSAVALLLISMSFGKIYLCFGKRIPDCLFRTDIWDAASHRIVPLEIIFPPFSRRIIFRVNCPTRTIWENNYMAACQWYLLTIILVFVHGGILGTEPQEYVGTRTGFRTLWILRSCEQTLLQYAVQIKRSETQSPYTNLPEICVQRMQQDITLNLCERPHITCTSRHDQDPTKVQRYKDGEGPTVVAWVLSWGSTGCTDFYRHCNSHVIYMSMVFLCISVVLKIRPYL